ncbi:CYTA5-like protein [Mya arenaria]|uniref:CYTA5-like protein n=1 Tax=Mya arenaria TaxID=6604 RepID=A0ABY7EH77_MYAAR|nr:CYTA5-like protein [Mya arenaria]WAR09450.1 CYTA5-like protein [Mya arenaria]
MLAGGAGPVQKANDDVKAVCNELKAEILQKAEKDAVEIFEAVSYRSQLVAGTNLFVKNGRASQRTERQTDGR